jgi:hypothetical protein
MKSSHQLCLELIEQMLQHAAGFQLHAAKQKVLVIRDALADDLACCDALLLKVDHLVDQAFAAPAKHAMVATVPAATSAERVLSAT